MKTGIELIAIERKRQIEKKGYDKDHDDEWDCGQLALAGAAYAIPPKKRKTEIGGDAFSACINYSKVLWPFEYRYYNPTPQNRIKELVKAGALIAAEIDRLNRVEKNESPRY
jgi:hypothetical protein